MAVYSQSVGVRVNADDLAAQALAIQLRTEGRETIKVYTDGNDYLVMPGDQDPPSGWGCAWIAYAH